VYTDEIADLLGVDEYTEAHVRYKGLGLTSFPGCCGISIIHNFPYGSSDTQTADLVKHLTKIIKAFQKEGTRILMVTLTRSQQSARRAVDQLGFKSIADTYNPKSNRTFDVYMLKTQEAKSGKQGTDTEMSRVR